MTIQTTWGMQPRQLECDWCGQIKIAAPIDVTNEQVAVRHERQNPGHDVWAVAASPYPGEQTHDD